MYRRVGFSGAWGDRRWGLCSGLGWAAYVVGVVVSGLTIRPPWGEVLCVEGCPVFPVLEPVWIEETAPAAWAFDVRDLVVAGHFVDCAHRAVQPFGDVFCCQVRGAAHASLGCPWPLGVSTVGVPPCSRFVQGYALGAVPTVPSVPVGSSVLSGVAGQVGECRGWLGCAGLSAVRLSGWRCRISRRFPSRMWRTVSPSRAWSVEASSPCPLGRLRSVWAVTEIVSPLSRTSLWAAAWGASGSR